MPRLLTVGHGALDRVALGALLSGAGVQVLVDVRRFPGSRNNPDVRQQAIEEWLPALGIDYRWEQDLGGRRRLPAEAPVVDLWWRVAQFRAYAAHTRSVEFAAALDRVLDRAATATVAVMCSESVWWRCHRRLIADVVSLSVQGEVRHLMPGGRLSDHRPADGARVRADGSLVWDVNVPPDTTPPGANAT